MDGAIGLAIVVGLCVAIVMFLRRVGLRQLKKEDAIDHEFIVSLGEHRLALQYLDLIKDIADQKSPVGYTELRGERFLDAFVGARNFDTKQDVVLIVTTRAIVAQSDYREDRVTWSSVRKFEIKRDGLELHKARGGRKAFKCEDPEFLALAEAAFLRSSK
jgi:hypothetical protein